MDFLKTIAPWIATALGGPLGGIAIDMATQALGVSDKTADGLKKALAGVSAEDMLKLKQAEQDFQAKMTELGYKNIADLEAIAAGDRKSAREMQMTTRSRIPAILSVIVTLGYFGLLLGMLGGWLKVSDSQALLLMLGSLTTGWGVVMAYWFGSTSGSVAKSELLAKTPPPK